MSRHGKRRRTSPEESYDTGSHDTAAFAAGGDPYETPDPGREPDADPDAAAPAEDEPAPASGRIRRPDPEPLEADDVKIVGIGTLIWFGLFLLSLPFRDTLDRDGREWWPWCALAGAGLGLLGLWYVRRRRDAIRRRADERR